MKINDERIIENRSEEIAVNLTEAIESSIGESLDSYPLEIRQLHDEFTSKLADFKAKKDFSEFKMESA